MVYDQSQGGYQNSWSQQGQGGQSAMPNHLWTGGSSGAEQAYTTTVPAMGQDAYGRNWIHGTPYAPQPDPGPYGRSGSDGRPIFTHYGQYQQPAAFGNRVIGSSGSHETVGRSQNTHIGQYASHQTDADPYQ
jgi:hypothetical protein